MGLKRSVMFQLHLRQFPLLLLSERDILGLFPRQTFSQVGGTLHVCRSGGISYLDDMMMMMMMRQVGEARKVKLDLLEKEEEGERGLFFVIQTT